MCPLNNNIIIGVELGVVTHIAYTVYVDTPAIIRCTLFKILTMKKIDIKKKIQGAEPPEV